MTRLLAQATPRSPTVSRRETSVACTKMGEENTVQNIRRCRVWLDTRIRSTYTGQKVINDNLQVLPLNEETVFESESSGRVRPVWHAVIPPTPCEPQCPRSPPRCHTHWCGAPSIVGECCRRYTRLAAISFRGSRALSLTAVLEQSAFLPPAGAVAYPTWRPFVTRSSRRLAWRPCGARAP
jgi:hypothetical protein